MAISKKLQETIEQTLELSGELLEQAGFLRQKVDLIESEKAVAELQNKLVQIKIRENWANAEARYYGVLACYNSKGAPSVYDVHGKPVLDMMDCPNCRTPEDWEHIWERAAYRLHRYHKQLTLQYFYGRNPKDVAVFSPKVIVNED